MKKSITHLNIRHETIVDMAQSGIHTLEQIIAMSEHDLCQFRQVGQKTARKLIAQAHAYLNDIPIVLQAPPTTVRQQGWYFDIETNPATNQIWSIGWCWQEEPTQVVVVAPRATNVTMRLPDGRDIWLVPDVASAWSRFADDLIYDDAPIYHWTAFDSSNLRQHAPPHVREALSSRLHDLHHSFVNTIQLPEKSNSLKVVAPYAGFRWRTHQDWRIAWDNYCLYLHTQRGEKLVDACQYQSDDVDAMVAVWLWINQLTKHHP